MSAQITVFRRVEDVEAAMDELRWQLVAISNLIARRDNYDEAVEGEALSSDICNTVREVFGADSREANEFKDFRINVMSSKHDTATTRRSLFERAATNAKTRVHALMTRLKERHDDLTSLRPSRRRVFHGREVHASIVAAAEALFADEYYAEAVFGAAKVLVTAVKKKSGLRGADGKSLMQRAFSVNGPILAFNKLRDQSDLDEQEGMMHLYEGAIMAIRNPGAHRRGGSMTAEQALRYLDVLSFLAQRLDEARKRRQ